MTANKPIVSLLMPVKGRPQQTASLIERIFSTTGRIAFELLIGIDDDEACYQALARYRDRCILVNAKPRRGYWKMLSYLSQYAEGRLLSNIANDVLPGLYWLTRAVRTHDTYFSETGGVVGYNDGLLFEGHTGHLLVDRRVLQRWYGTEMWPTMYDHLYGDTEMCQRAIKEEIYRVDLRSVLFHNHPVVGREGDSVYTFSHQKEGADKHIFEARRRAGWQ